MALQIEKLKREFNFKDKDGKEKKLPDPGAHLTPEEVIKYYAGNYPQLTTAKLEGPKVKDDVQVFSITSQTGSKG